MPSFERAGTAVATMMVDLIRDHHEDLLEAGVSVDLVMVSEEDEDGNLQPALKHQGYPAAGVAKITPKKDRAKGLADAEICLDKLTWDSMTRRQRQALLDHELTHLVVTDKVDDLRRPVLRLRKHDHQFGWFDDVAARWGGDLHAQTPSVPRCRKCSLKPKLDDRGRCPHCGADGSEP